MVSLRLYDVKDFHQCHGLWAELTMWHRLIYEDDRIGGDDPGSSFDDHLKRVGEENVYVADDMGVIVGLTSLIISEGEAEVEPVIVTETKRGTGIGKQLVQHMVEEAKRRNIRYVNVKPVARNIEAIRFFHSQGFQTAGHIQLFIDLKNKEWKKGITIHDKQFKI